MRYQRQEFGFTLAELLIALAILGVIATFTIPKILDSGSDAKKNAIAKETIATISALHQEMKLNGNISSSTTAGDIMQNLNYIRLRTTGFIDNRNLITSVPCSSYRCYELANGAVVTGSNNAFNGSNDGCTMFFYLDPDGEYSGMSTGPGKSLLLYLSYQGKIMTAERPLPGHSTAVCAAALNPIANADPDWFSWSN